MSHFQAFVRKKGGARISVAPIESRTAPDGTVCDSKLECKVYGWLLDMGVNPECLHKQVTFELLPKFEFENRRDGKKSKIRAINYVSDFVIAPKGWTLADGVSADTLIIDAKGWETPEFKIKKKVFMYRYGAHIHLVGKSKRDLLELLEQYNVVPKTAERSLIPGCAGAPSRSRTRVRKV